MNSEMTHLFLIFGVAVVLTFIVGFFTLLTTK